MRKLSSEITGKDGKGKDELVKMMLTEADIDQSAALTMSGRR